MKKHCGIYILVCITQTLAVTAADAPKDPFEQLNKQAEEQYKKSSDQTEREKKIQKDNINEPASCATKTPLTLDDALYLKYLTVQQPWIWSFERLSCNWKAMRRV